MLGPFLVAAFNRLFVPGDSRALEIAVALIPQLVRCRGRAGRPGPVGYRECLLLLPTHSRASIHVGHPSPNSYVSPLHFIVLRQRLSLNPRLTDLAGVASHQAPGATCLHLPPGTNVINSCLPNFMWMLGIQTQMFRPAQ